MNDLKRFYEEERERIERRSLDERARFERKITMIAAKKKLALILSMLMLVNILASRKANI